jgi:hypothetical protein
MVAVAFSILFGIIAVSAMAAIRNSIVTGVRRGHVIRNELERQWGVDFAPVTRPLRLPHLQRGPKLQHAAI